MGKADVGNTNSNFEQPESKTGTGKTGTSGNRNSKTTGTGTGTSGTGRGTSGTGNGTSGTETIKTEKVGKVSVLTDLPDVNIPEPQQPKQKRKYTKKAKEENTSSSFDSKQISAFIVAVSSMVASREGMTHWLISESEAEQIAKPLANIIAKSEQLKVLGEHADAFALVTACMMIFAPRLIITFQNKSKKGVIKTNGTGKHNNDTKSRESNKSVHRENAVTPSDDGKTIYESISALQ